MDRKLRYSSETIAEANSSDFDDTFPLNIKAVENWERAKDEQKTLGVKKQQKF